MSEKVEDLAPAAFAAGCRTATERALALPEILEAIVAFARSAHTSDIWHLRLVNKTWKAVTEPQLVDVLYITSAQLVAQRADGYCSVKDMLKKEPTLHRSVKEVVMQPATSLDAPDIDLLASFSNLSMLELLDRDVTFFTSLWTVPAGTFAKLRSIAFDLELPLLRNEDVRAKCHHFFESLANLDTMHIVLFSTGKRDVSLSDFYLGEIFGSMAGQIRKLDMSSLHLDRCHIEDISHLFKIFVGVKVLNLSLPEPSTDSYVPGLVDYLPRGLLSLELACGERTLTGVLESLANPAKLPNLRLVPTLHQSDCFETFALGTMPRGLIDKALRGLEMRNGLVDMEEGKVRLYNLVRSNDRHAGDIGFSADVSTSARSPVDRNQC